MILCRDPTLHRQLPSNITIISRHHSKKPPGTLVSPTAHQVDREYRVLKALSDANSGFPSPKVFTYSDDSNVCGTPFFVMEYIGPGRIQTLDISLPQARDAEERRAMWIEMMRVMAQLHKLDPFAMGLRGFGKDKGFYERNITNWGRLSRQQARVRSMDDPNKEVGDAFMLEEMLVWFNKHIVKDETTIFHGDLVGGT
jgi:aminoglycoside phosphotransferase (APT) family kinase protein